MAEQGQPKAQSAGATDATEQTTEQQTLLGHVLEDMEPEVRSLVEKAEQKIPEPKAETESAPQEEQASEEQPAEQTEEQAEPEQTEEPETTESSETEEEEEKVTDEWPDSAKKRLSDEIRKRKQRTEERDRLIAERERILQQNALLQQQAAAAQIPKPTRKEPLANVFNMQELDGLKSQMEEIVEFADTNPEGAFDYDTGSGKKEDFPPERLAKMKSDANRILRAIPERKEYLQARYQWDTAAQIIYPELRDGNSAASIEARQILSAFPELSRSPEVLLWVGYALEGRQAAWKRIQAAQNAQKTNSVKKVIGASKIAKAPAPARTGTPPSRHSVDIEAARKRLYEGDSDQGKAMEALIAAKLQGGRSGATKPALV